MQNIRDLKAIEDSYSLIMELVNDALVIYDMDGIITNTNAKFSDMTGHQKDKIIGRSITDFLDHDNKQELLKHSQKRKNNKEQFECIFIAKDDLRFNALVSLSPFYDKAGAYKGSLAVIKDNTGLKQTEKHLINQEQELETKTTKIEELSATVKVLLENSDENKRKIEEQVLSNVRELVKPYLEKLKMNGLNERQKIYLSVLESNIKKITSQFSHKLSLDYSHLTHSELQIANLVKDGKSSKEIANILCISERTVDTHRNRIRKKLGITNKKDNLKSYLLSIQ